MPIDPQLPQICAQLARHGRLVLRAEPGAGKTTRVPPALLDAGVFAGQCWVVQPRRMAAVLSARRVASERGEACGQQIGYSVRLDERVTSQTRVRYVTDGLFLRRLIGDPQLQGIGAVVFDEFHERRAAMDIGLAVARRLQQARRPDLKIAVMSATLDADSLAHWLQAPVQDCQGRVFPVQVHHDATLDQRPLEERVVAAVRRAMAGEKSGDVLVFLPGAGEIRRCAQAIDRANWPDCLAVPLHGSLPLRDQEAALQPTALRKIILATNIAETSLTLPNVVAVIDAGTARVAGYAAWSGLPTLQLQAVSKASATQRAGRAGRVRPGTCWRLYTQHDHDARPSFDTPELQRTDLAECALLLASLPADLRPADGDDFWLTRPSAEALGQARTLLGRLGALDGAGELTAAGREMLRWPLPPRLAATVAAGQQLGVGKVAVTAAALLAERSVRAGNDDRPFFAPHGWSDVLQLLDDFAACCQGASPRDRGLDRQAFSQARQAVDQLAKLLQRPDDAKADVAHALGMALLRGFGDRLARRRAAGSPDVEMAGGQALKLGKECQVTEAQFLVVLDAEERRDGRTRANWVRLGHGVDELQILEVLGDELQTQQETVLQGKRAVVREKTLVQGLELDSRTFAAPKGPPVAALLVAAARADGWQGAVDPEAWQALRERLAFARDQAGLAELPAGDEPHLLAVAERAALDCAHLDELRNCDLLGCLRQDVAASMGGQGLRQLDQAAPETMTLPGGRKLRIQYPAGQAPWTQSRMQDFFGLRDGPKVSFGQVPVVLHLLAPNQRPVQVTTDLAGFWQRHWPAIRRELCRLYPRHLWPEDPLDAKPPPPGRPR